MLLRIAFLVVACLVLSVLCAEDYYKVCSIYVFNCTFQDQLLTKSCSYLALRKMLQNARSRKPTEPSAKSTIQTRTRTFIQYPTNTFWHIR
jgi:hypothetical protein